LQQPTTTIAHSQIQLLVMPRDQYIARGQQCGQLSVETNFNFVRFLLSVL